MMPKGDIVRFSTVDQQILQKEFRPRFNWENRAGHRMKSRIHVSVYVTGMSSRIRTQHREKSPPLFSLYSADESV
jgi:hypothetical protein